MAQRLLVLKSQKDVIFGDITKAGLDPTAFEWLEVQSLIRPETVVSKLVHKETGFYFQFDHGRDSPYGSHFFERHPGPDIPVDRQYSGGWDLLKQGFLAWLEALKLELESPDLWSRLASQPTLATAAVPDNEPLSADDQTNVAAAVSEVRAYLKQREALDDQRWDDVNEKLDTIVDASQRLGRKDWMLLTLGALISIFASGRLRSRTGFNLLSLCYGDL